MSAPRDLLATYFPGLDEHSRQTAERLIDLVFDVISDAQHERKWGRLTFTRNGDWHHWLCAVVCTPKAVKLVVHKGALLADPCGVMEGEGRYLRTIPFRSPDEVDADVVARILREASGQQTEM